MNYSPLVQAVLACEQNKSIILLSSDQGNRTDIVRVLAAMSQAVNYHFYDQGEHHLDRLQLQHPYVRTTHLSSFTGWEMNHSDDLVVTIRF